MTTDIHFTVICFTAGTCEPVMCAVILKSEKDASHIPDSWKFGIDLPKTVNNGESDFESFEKNSGEGQAMQGGPTCNFQGKKSRVCWFKSKGEHYKSADMLQFLDSFSLFDWSTGAKPFLLEDGHHTRLDLPF
jgi:hypothetical protein